jgi:hypothetical protein
MATLCVPGGSAAHDKAGERFAPSQVNLAGISPPAGKLGLLTARAGTFGSFMQPGIHNTPSRRTPTRLQRVVIVSL